MYYLQSWLQCTSRLRIDCDFVVICYSATRLAPSNRSRRLSFLPASGHYANEDAPDQGGNLRISAKSGRTSRVQEGKSRWEKKERDREARAVRSCEVIYIQTDFQLSGVRTSENSRRHRRKGGTGEDRAWSGFIFGLACLVAVYCPSSLRLFFAPLSIGSMTSSPSRHAVFPPSSPPTCRFTWKRPPRPPRIFYAKTCMKTRGPSSRVKRPTSTPEGFSCRLISYGHPLVNLTVPSPAGICDFYLLFPEKNRSRNPMLHVSSFCISYFC